MAQAMYVCPKGAPGQRRAMAVPKKAASINHWLKEARKAVSKDIPTDQFVLDRSESGLEKIIFYGKYGDMIVVLRYANALSY